MRRLRPKILVLYNEPVLPASHPDAHSEHEILFTVGHVTDALSSAGFRVTPFGVGRDVSALWACLHKRRPDVVFNLFEGAADHGDTEAYVAGLLDWFGAPFTGAPPSALCVARGKHLTKYLLRGAGIPTPEFAVVEELPLPDITVPWPVIVKPALEDASVGIDHGSVVDDPDRLEDRVASLLERYGPPVLVERYVPGREFNVSLIEAPELRVLPLSETIFPRDSSAPWPILTYQAKWVPGTNDFETIQTCCPADVAPDLARRVERLARTAFRLVGCRGYGRVDVRVTPAGEAYVIEVNPNSDLSPLAGLATGLEAAGLTWRQFVVDLVRTSIAAGPRKEPVAGPSAACYNGPDARISRKARR
jgi:D-alanine-D-alanine ligase